MKKQFLREALSAGLSEPLALKYAEYATKKERKADRLYRSGRLNTGYRDSDQTAVYRAEWAFEAKAGLPRREFETLEQAAKWGNKILKSRTWEKLSDRRSVMWVERRGNSATSYGYRIELGTQSMGRYVILHELAHSAGFMHHDVGFRVCLLKLVSRFLGRENAAMLKAEFRKAGLKTSIPPVRIKDPEEWYEYYSRITEARLARA